MIEVEKRRTLVNPGRRRRRMSMAEKLAFVRRMKRARAAKHNLGSRTSIRKLKKRYKKNHKFGKARLGKGQGYHFMKPPRKKHRKHNVSSIITVYPGISGNPGRKRRKYRKNRGSKRVVVINKGAKMAVRRKRRSRVARRRVARRRRHHNVVYRKRIKRGMYAYSSNPGRRRRRRHNRAVTHRRRRRNPGFSVGGGGIVTKVAGVVGGLAVTKLLCGFLPASLSVGPLGYLSTAAIAVAQGKLIGKLTKSPSLGNDMVIGGLAYLAAKILNDFFPQIGGYTGISGMGLIGGSSFYSPQVNLPGNMGAFVVPSAVMGALPSPSAAVGAGASMGRLRRTGRVM